MILFLKRLFMKYIIISILMLFASAEAKIKTLPVDSKNLTKYITEAKKTLPYFLKAYSNPKYKKAYFLLKHKINSDDNSETTHLWFIFLKKEGEYFYIKEFELPEGYSKYKNKIVKIKEDEIEDWWVQDGGKLYGAFTIKYQIDKLKTQKEKDKLKAYMGIDEHMTTMP